MVSIQLKRLRSDIEATAEFGAIDVKEGCGRTVLTGSPADKEAREYLIKLMKEEGLDVRVDAVGNIAGRWVPNSADPSAAPVAAGSHLDSVPQGGIFDGVLGVYGALESVRAIRESGIETRRPIEVVSFTEEEGIRFPTGLLGSSVAAGQRSAEDALEMEDKGGTTLAEHLESIGFHRKAEIDASSWDAWCELHVEQSKRLEQRDVSVGLVDTIVGITNCTVKITGETNHAGTTEMSSRTDAMAAASEFILAVERAACDAASSGNESAVATMGQLSIDPNVVSAVPGLVELTIDCRATDHRLMDQIIADSRRCLQRLEDKRGVETDFDRFRDQSPTQLSDRCLNTAKAAANSSTKLSVVHSGATHDTVNVAQVTDSLLLFAPSVGGVSHSPREWTRWEDCARAAETLARTIGCLASSDAS